MEFVKALASAHPLLHEAAEGPLGQLLRIAATAGGYMVVLPPIKDFERGKDGKRYAPPTLWELRCHILRIIANEDAMSLAGTAVRLTLRGGHIVGLQFEGFDEKSVVVGITGHRWIAKVLLLDSDTAVPTENAMEGTASTRWRQTVSLIDSPQTIFGAESRAGEALKSVVMRKAAELNEKSETALLAAYERSVAMVDTEVAMFCSGYVCVTKFERFIISKVTQLVDSCVETLIGEEIEWDDDDKDAIAASFHTLVTGGVAPKVTSHWDTLFDVENVAVHHACKRLQEASRVGDIVSSVIPARLAQTKELVASIVGGIQRAASFIALLDHQGLSVMSYASAVECALRAVTSSELSRDLSMTADECIPLLEAAVISGAPMRAVSRIRYTLQFMWGEMELSSMGYALATLEASVEQTLADYRCLVEQR